MDHRDYLEEVLADIDVEAQPKNIRKLIKLSKNFVRDLDDKNDEIKELETEIQNTKDKLREAEIEVDNKYHYGRN